MAPTSSKPATNQRPESPALPAIKHLARLQGTNTAAAADAVIKFSPVQVALLDAAARAQAQLVLELHQHPARHANVSGAYQASVDADAAFLEAAG